MRLVATVLTVYGIETIVNFSMQWKNLRVATVLTVYGIETYRQPLYPSHQYVV